MFLSDLKIGLRLLLASCLLLPAGCARDDSSGVPQAVATPVTLDLRVAVGESLTQGETRGFPLSDDETFEGPASEYEKLHTLRVIIVHANGKDAGKIEHNRQVTLNTQTGIILNDNLRFRVASGEKKIIYLFGNEAAVTQLTGFDFSSLGEGTEFPTEKITALTLRRPANGALIYNASEGKNYIPMSESFEVDVPRSESGLAETFQQNLFITRSAIKFSFNLIVAPDYKMSGVSVTGIKISGLADAGYYMPKNTVYSPGKSEQSSNALRGRLITSFEAPADPGFSGYEFPILPVEIKAETDVKFFPQVYFPESKREGGSQPFTVTLLLDGPGAEYLTPRPLSLTDIPRNTHVKINIHLSSTDIRPEVELLPYTGVKLEPTFGL